MSVYVATSRLTGTTVAEVVDPRPGRSAASTMPADDVARHEVAVAVAFLLAGAVGLLAAAVVGLLLAAGPTSEPDVADAAAAAVAGDIE